LCSAGRLARRGVRRIMVMSVAPGSIPWRWQARARHAPQRGFTLAELLVVLGIVALLAGLLLPVVNRSRASAQRVTCRANLRDIGAQFQMYLNESRNHLPWVNTMPSVTPPINAAPSIVKVLEPYARSAKQVYRCPADRITLECAGAPAGYATYFEREGCSYQYNPFLASIYAGKQLKDTWLYENGRQNLLFIFKEYEPFHGPAGRAGAMNYLMADMSVRDLVE